MPRPVHVFKFGGTSVRDAARIQHVVRLVQAEDPSTRRVVVTSALGGVTDELLRAADEAVARTNGHRTILDALRARHEAVLTEVVRAEEQAMIRDEIDRHFFSLGELLDGVSLLRECTARAKDSIAGMGEKLAAPLVAAAFRSAGEDAVAVDSTALVLTDDRFGEANVQFRETNVRIRDFFSGLPEGRIAVVTGFLGATPRGVTTTLGRSGSDYTATVFGGALDAERVVIWTDVDGVLSADPRLVPEAETLDQLHYREAAELAYFGAKVLHPRTMRPLIERRIPLLIKNTLNPDAPGTLITDDEVPGAASVRGVTTIRDVSLVTLEGTGFMGVPGVLARALSPLASEGINVFMTSQASSEESLSMVVRRVDTEDAVKALEAVFAPEISRGDARILSRTSCAIVTAVGDAMRDRAGVAGRIFEALGFEEVNVLAIAQSAAQNSITAVVEDRHARKALRAMHEAFHRERETVRVFIVGATGGVGRALVKMMGATADSIFERTGLRLQIIGLASSRHQKLHPAGLPADALDTIHEGDPADLGALTDALADLPHRRIVFVDSTASEEVADLYPRLLESGIAVVTPNKRANTRDLAFYRTLQKLGKETPFLYETTVGAGLPVIATLRDLVRSGDRVLRIEGVLSGTLAFVFSELRAGRSFSEAVFEAKRRGYTEPDPRDDLSGRDVARKLLTLAREAGIEVEPGAVEVESLVPEALRGIPMQEFLEKLPDYDELWRERLRSLPSGHRIAYVGTVEGTDLRVGVRKIAPATPLSILEGTDSLVAYTTDRYERPLVVFGPGAGPEITAAGVLADIVHAAMRMGERL